MDDCVNDEILRIEGLRKKYREGDVLNCLDFTVKRGEFLSILGSSGCGKTTLLRILIGLLRPDEGKVLKDGHDITYSRPDRRGMGIVFQNYALFENMTVLGNVEYALKVKKETRETARETAEKMLEAVGLTEYAGKMPRALSGGQQQRVAIARTLALHPDIILFDEPMSALDVSTRILLRGELKKIQAAFGTTMIYVTHDQEEAFAMSDRIMILHEGDICQLDTPEEICKHPADEYVRTFVLDNLRAKIDSLSKFAEEMQNGGEE